MGLSRPGDYLGRQGRKERTLKSTLKRLIFFFAITEVAKLQNLTRRYVAAQASEEQPEQPESSDNNNCS